MAVTGIKLFGAEVQGPIQASRALLYAPSNGLGADLVHVAEGFRVCAPTLPSFPKAFETYRTALAPGDPFAPSLLTSHWGLVDAIRETPAATWKHIVVHVKTTAPWLVSAGWFVTSHDPVHDVGAFVDVNEEQIRSLMQAFDAASAAVRTYGFGSEWAEKVETYSILSPAVTLAEKLSIADQYQGRLYGQYPCLEYLRRGKTAILAGDLGLALYEVSLGATHTNEQRISEALQVLGAQIATAVTVVPEDRVLWYGRFVNLVDGWCQHWRYLQSISQAENLPYFDQPIAAVDRLYALLDAASPDLDPKTHAVLQRTFSIIPRITRDPRDLFCRLALRAIAPADEGALAELMVHLDAVEALIRSLLEGKPQREALQRIGSAQRALREHRATITVGELMQIEKKALKAGADNLASRAREAIDALYAACAPGIGKGPPGG